MKRIISVLLTCTFILTLAGCSNPTNDAGQEEPIPSVTQSEESKTDNTVSNSNINVVYAAEKLKSEDMFSNRDCKTDYDEESAVKINLSDNKIICDSKNVLISDNTITILDEGLYIISGTLENGQIIVDVDQSKKVQLVLDHAYINCNTSAAIYIKQADKVFLTLAEGSDNALSNQNEFIAIDDNNIDSVLFSKEDLTLNGTGSLTINAAYGHGIVSKDDLVLTGGNYTITSENHGLSGKDSVRIADGSYTIISGKDGIHSSNSDQETKGFIYIENGAFHITCENDGIDSANSLQIEDGDFTILSGGGSANAITQNTEKGFMGKRMREHTTSVSESDSASTKGLKAAGDIMINSGTFALDCLDDTIHSDSNVSINDGIFEITTGDDGIHANESTIIHGGTINITKSYEGIEGKNVEITGGTITLYATDDGINAAGSQTQSGMIGKPGQGTLDADTYIHISGGKIHVNAEGDGIDSNGNVIVSGGELYISGSTNNSDAAIDYDGTAQITGGIVVATGSNGMAQNFGQNSTQGSILVSLSASQVAGTEVLLKDGAGTILATYTPDKQYNSVVVSSPTIKQGETYTLIAGTETSSIEMTDLIYSSGGFGGGMGNFGGGMKGGNKGTMPDDFPDDKENSRPNNRDKSL